MLQDQIRQLPIYHRTSEKIRRRMLEEGRIVSIKKGEHLFRIRDHVEQIYMILSGYVVLEREGEDHGHKCLFILGQGDIVNEVILDYGSASVTCTALTEMTALVYPRPVFLSFMEQDTRFNRYVVESMALKIRKLYHMLEGSTKVTRLDHQVASRIWKFARDFGVETEKGIELPFELRITMLASFVGSNRETVSRIVKKMSEEGILSIRRGCCTIYDMEALREFSVNYKKTAGT